jgi:hypothetical protein
MPTYVITCFTMEQRLARRRRSARVTTRRDYNPRVIGHTAGPYQVLTKRAAGPSPAGWP